MDIGRTLAWIGFFAAVFFGWFFFIKARNKERMALIEAGKDVSEIYSNQQSFLKFPWLKLGILITGVSLGLVVAILALMSPALENVNETSDGVVLFIPMLFFGGVAMIIAHFIGKREKQ